MAIIHESKNFIVESREQPFVTRTDGGHIMILAKDSSITDRTKLIPKQAIEVMRLTMAVGEAMKKGLKKRGINVVRINYAELGNWAFKEGKKPYFHIHLFGRAKDAVHQPFPEAVQLPDRKTGFYDKFIPLNEQDVMEIQNQLKIILKKEKYQDKKWRL